MPKRKYRRKIYKRRKRMPLIILKVSLTTILISLFLGVGLFIYFIKDLPRPEKFTEGVIAQSTKIYDRDGQVILYEIFGEERRTIVSLDEMPEFLKWAFISAEDKNFFKHRGLDFKGIFRAFLYDLKLGKPVQGGSTITQQLIRCYFLTRHKTLKRKTREMILTLELERRYSKEQILEWYLNLIPFGGNLYGVEEASQNFFGKHISDISLAEAAILASLVKAPSYFSPYGDNLRELLERKDYILERMFNLNYISQEEFEKAKKEEVLFRPNITSIEAPHFVLFVKDYLEKKYGRDFLNRKGLKVYTTLDFEIQKTAESVLKEGVEAIKNYNAYNGALVSINPKTGEILAMVGSKNWHATSSEGCDPETLKCKFDPKMNAALALRQPGSALKPFVYTQAFLEGLTPQTVVWDVKTEFNINCSPDADEEFGKYNSECYHPKNYDNKFLGLINLKSALAQSRNLPSIKVLYLAGTNKVLELLKDFGITTLKEKERYGLSLVLGGGEVRLIELVSAYGVFAQDGLKTPLKFIIKIEDSEGNIIEKPNTSPTRILPSYPVREINDILSDNQARAPMFGINSPLNLKDYQVAAKTGTTQDYKDAWIIGYTPNLVTGVWVGNNDNSPMMKKPAVSLAGPIWKNFMTEVLKNFPKEEFTPPQKRLTGIHVIDGEMPENHSILHYLNKEDPQYYFWEKGVINFLKEKGIKKEPEIDD